MKFISLGSSCSIAENLKVLGLREESLPFDWIKVNNFKNINIMITSSFNKLWDFNNFELIKSSSKFFYLNGNSEKVYICMDIFRNNDYNAVFYHDFPSKGNDYLVNENFVEKYKRKVSRFFNLIENNKQIIFIREQINPKQINSDELLLFYQIIKKINPMLEFKLVIIQNNFLKKDITKLINFCDSQKWIDLYVENSKIEKWERFDIINPIIQTYLDDLNQYPCPNQSQNQTNF